MRDTSEGGEEIDRPDDTENFHELWSVTVELMAKITARFDVRRDPSTDRWEAFGGDADGASGHLAAFSGPEMDWLVHSWIRDPRQGFSDMRIAAWLGPHIDVPHLGVAWGTLPDLWFCIDYTPRSDLMVDAESLERYYEPLNAQFLELRADDGLVPLTSTALYVRQSLSEVAACYTTEPTRRRREQIRRLAHDHVDRWLRHVDEAVPVAEDRRARLAAEDLTRRRTIAERDPTNRMNVRLFGEDTTDHLVRARWGGDRRIPRHS